MIKAEGKGNVFKTAKIHSALISAIKVNLFYLNFKYNEVYNTVISIDTSGIIEYWDPVSFGKNFCKIFRIA